MPRPTLVAVSMLAIQLGTAGCTVAENASECSESPPYTCVLTVTGEQAVHIGLGDARRYLTVDDIEPASVAMSVRGEVARVTVGQTTTVADLHVTLHSVSDKTAELTITY